MFGLFKAVVSRLYVMYKNASKKTVYPDGGFLDVYVAGVRKLTHGNRDEG